MVLRWYTARLAKQPLLTQAITTAILFATGDVIAQQVVEKKGIQKHEWIRTGRMFAYGGVIFGPSAATWYRILQRISIPSRPNLQLAARVAADQCVFAPVFCGVFLASMATMERSSVRAKLDAAYWPALKANYVLWPAVQVVNFKFVPLQHRLMVVNVVAIGWNCFLSMINNTASEAGKGEKVEVELEVEEKKKKKEK
ncbi:Protein required for ethanol metabolism [Zalerion maritima]|uniref:Protein required for ethanol metabolism n=1 Tax=Zalerion maritima TaxID=339359 RepID=A0AAD5RXE6_9PEZI|nr:Protein required for ethanol metabolism [Zalerion maritima]